MIIFIQFSITDVRAFKDKAPELLITPSWPSPTPNSEFVRASGRIVERTKKGLNNWIGENFICKIQKGIKIAKPVRIDEYNIKLNNVGKHQYSSERNILTKYEFVFASKNISNIIIDWNLIQKIICQVVDVPVSIRTTSYKYNTVQLKSIKKSLKEFYILNSTKHGNFNLDLQLQYIYDCTPQIYLYLESNESYHYGGERFISLSSNKFDFFNLYSVWYKVDNMPFRLWIYKSKPLPFSNDLDRIFRISILRLHSEYECLKNILKAITYEKIKVFSHTEESNYLQSYLTRTINTILNEEEKVAKQSEEDFIDEIRKIFFDFQPGEFTILKERIISFNFRPQIQNKTINYINKLEIMNDKYENKGQVGAMGYKAKAENNNFQQVNYTIPSDIDFDKLKEEIIKIKNKMKVEAESPEDFFAVQQVAQAEKEAEVKNANGVVSYLKAGGKWVVDTATEIGVTVVSELIRQNLGQG